MLFKVLTEDMNIVNANQISDSILEGAVQNDARDLFMEAYGHEVEADEDEEDA